MVTLTNQNTGARHEFATEGAALEYAVSVYGVSATNAEILQATGQADGLVLTHEESERRTTSPRPVFGKP